METSSMSAAGSSRRPIAPRITWDNVLWLHVLGVGVAHLAAVAGDLGASWAVWGVAVRVTFVLHATWFVNSVGHCFGYRNYDTRDNSRNSFWVALLTFGEGWHNNH